MTVATTNSFVLFPIGKKRFALPSGLVAELARPDRLQNFPHTMPMISGVLIKRGHVIPVFDLASTLAGADAPGGKFYLIATHRFTEADELIAIPVTGECELMNASVSAPGKHSPSYVSGTISVGEEMIEVVQLESLIEADLKRTPNAPAEVSA